MRNKKPPALRVGNKRLYQKTHLSVTIKLFKLIVKKRKVSKMANKTNSLSSTTWMCKYHIVFIPKYRRKAIYGQYRESLQEIIRTLCRYKGVERRTYDARSCALTIKYTTKNERVKLYGIFEGKKRIDDV